MAIEELGTAIHEKVRGLVGEEAGLAILGTRGQVLWSSMHEDRLSLAREITRRFSSLWNEGDYYVSASEEERLVVIKATENVCLALSARAREGLMLLTLRSIISSFSQALREAGEGIEAIGEEEIDIWPLLVLEPDSGRELKVVPHDAVLSLSEPSGSKVIRLDERVLAIIRAVDGKTVAAIADEVGMGVEEACRLIAELVEAGILRAKVKEMLKPDFNAVFSLAPGVSLEGAMRLANELGQAAKIAVANLDRGYSVLELSWGLRGLGLDIKPDELLDVLRRLEDRGLIRRVM
ncbi:hypothetical protein DRN94_003235 [archaeon]|nr:hypothetical protein [archaeon]